MQPSSPFGRLAVWSRAIQPASGADLLISDLPGASRDGKGVSLPQMDRDTRPCRRRSWHCPGR